MTWNQVIVFLLKVVLTPLAILTGIYKGILVFSDTVVDLWKGYED
jgi:predicted membrane protein